MTTEAENDETGHPWMDGIGSRGANPDNTRYGQAVQPEHRCDPGTIGDHERVSSRTLICGVRNRLGGLV